MKKYSICLIIIILFASIIQIIPSEQNNTYIRNNTSSNQPTHNITDIPVWCSGDSWIYEADIISDAENGLFSLNSNDLTIKVFDTNTILHEGKPEEIYRINLSGNVTGTIQSSILTGDVDGEIIGNASIRQADLSLITSDITMLGTIEYLIIFESDFFMTSYAEYYPRFEYFDFPLETNEEWNTSTTAYQLSTFYVEDFYPENTSEGTLSMSGYAESLNKEMISVPAGSFDCFHLISESNGTIESWFAPELKNVAKMYINNTNETEMSKVWLNLSNFNLHDQQVNITAGFSHPIVNVSDLVTISGYVNKTADGTPLINTDVTIHLPYTNKTWIATTNLHGFFTHTFIAPLILDSTNTSYDIGSDGVIISVNTGSLSGYMVKTLTVIGIAIDDIQAIPPIQYETLGVNISCLIYSVEELTNMTVSITGPVGFTPINMSLQGAGSDQYYYIQPYTIIGDYSYYIWAKNSLGNTNISMIQNFTIIADTIPPTIQSISAQPNPQWEYYPLNISCQVTDNVAVSIVNVIITDPLSTQHNISMTQQGDNHYYNTTYSIIGNYTYMIWVEDTLGNANNSTTFQFTIMEDTQPPTITDVNAYPNPQWEDYPVNISCSVIDNVEVNLVHVIITDPFSTQHNISMTQQGDDYYYNTTYSILGNYTYMIWAEDTLGNTQTSSINTFTIKPQIPEISNVNIHPNPQQVEDYVNISCIVTDNLGIHTVKIYLFSPNGTNLFNTTMNHYQTNNYYYFDNYTQNGTYSFYIWANDTSGYTNQSSMYTFDIVNQSIITIDIEMDIGWNLITVPIENEWYASDLADNITGSLSVSRWDSVNQTYNTFIVGGPPVFDFPIEDGSGYFVDVNQISIFSLTGFTIFNVSIPLEIGWNLLGWYHEYNTTASSLSANITGSLSVSRWDSVNQTYNTFIVGGPPVFDFNIHCGMGLFVDVNQQSIWYGHG
jgi:hypothetical protein